LKQAMKWAAGVWLLVGCAGPDANTVGGIEGQGSRVWECKDGQDNDLDGLFDCEDEDCSESESCVGMAAIERVDSGLDSDDSAAADSVVTVGIVPANPTTDDDLECLVTEPLSGESQVGASYRFVWSQGGSQVSESPSVSSDQTDEGQAWSCEVTVTLPNDGLQITGFDEVQVLENHPPGAPVVVIQDTPDYLVCIVSRAAEDPDGDPVRYGYSWETDGEGRNFQGAVISKEEETSNGETWTCYVSTCDGYSEGEIGSASIVIGY